MTAMNHTGETHEGEATVSRMGGASLTSGRVFDLVTADGDEAQTSREICAVALELAKERPLVIGVDDVQFADPQSQQLLLYLQRRLASTRILLIVTEWDRMWSTNPRFG